MKQILILLCVLLLLAACDDDNRRVSDWTVMVYMAADNNLSEQAVVDINEMESAVFTEDVRVIALVDWSIYSEDSRAKKYRILHDESPEIKSDVISTLGEIDSGDWGELSGFVNSTIRSYPARNYALIIWSHGDSWYRDGAQRDICFDDESNNEIGVRNGDLERAMVALLNKMDILIFDACLMQGVEVIGETAGKADYIIGSEEEIPWDGFPFKEVLEIWNSNSSSRDIASAIVDQYVDSYRPGGSQEGSNLKIMCSAAYNEDYYTLKYRINQFVKTWIDSANTAPFMFARESCDEYGSVMQDIDIRQFFTELRKQATVPGLIQDVDEVLLNIDDLFYHSDQYNCPDSVVATGTIWFPDNPVILDNLKTDYENLHFSSSGWLQFLEKFHADD